MHAGWAMQSAAGSGALFRFLFDLVGARVSHALGVGFALLPFALWHTFRARHHRGVRFLLTWFAVAFASLSLIDSKQIHYTTLLLPQASLVIGFFAAPPAFRSMRRSPARLRAAFKVVAALLAGAGMGLLVAPWAGAPIPREAGAAFGLVIVALGMAFRAFSRQRFGPWILVPAFFIFLTVICFNIIGDALRDCLDPMLKGNKPA